MPRLLSVAPIDVQSLLLPGTSLFDLFLLTLFLFRVCLQPFSPSRLLTEEAYLPVAFSLIPPFANGLSLSYSSHVPEFACSFLPPLPFHMLYNFHYKSLPSHFSLPKLL